jgi:hypothetical protein
MATIRDKLGHMATLFDPEEIMDSILFAGSVID